MVLLAGLRGGLKRDEWGAGLFSYA